MPVDEFFEEVKQQFARHLTTKSNIDQKINNMITMSGMIATLLLGLSVFLMKILQQQLFYVQFSFIVLIIGMFCMIGAIMLCFSAYRITFQMYPIIAKPFFKNNDASAYDNTVTEEWMTRAKDDFQKLFIEEYLRSIKKCEEVLDSKGNKVEWAEILFIIGIITLPIAGIILGLGVFNNPTILSQITLN